MPERALMAPLLVNTDRGSRISQAEILQSFKAGLTCAHAAWNEPGDARACASGTLAGHPKLSVLSFAASVILRACSALTSCPVGMLAAN